MIATIVLVQYAAAARDHCKPGKVELTKCGKRVRSHFRKKDKIAIIGAGVSGISMANLLLEHGYENIKVLEATHRAGGYANTQTLYDIRHELGTCYSNDRYDCVSKLAKNVFMELTAVKSSTDYNIDNLTISGFDSYMFYTAMRDCTTSSHTFLFSETY